MSTQHGVRLVKIDERSDDQRLDNFLLRELKGVPKSLIYRIIRKGEVRVNKGRARPETRIHTDDIVRIPPVNTNDAVTIHKPGIGLLKTLEESVVYESDELMVVNKPSGLAVHGGSGVNLGLIEALRSKPNAPRFLELVHRLDRDTSGCVMIAKKRSMLRYLQELLRNEGKITKRYVAVVTGVWPKRKHQINLPLHRNETGNGERFVEIDHARGKASRTRFEVLEVFDRATFVIAQPLTGRTHQIRVHAKSAGHPLVGDTKYGDERTNARFRELGLKRLFLHASALTIPMRDGSQLNVEAALPKAFESGLAALRPSCHR